MTFDALKFVITTNIFQLLPVSSAPTSECATCNALLSGTLFQQACFCWEGEGWSLFRLIVFRVLNNEISDRLFRKSS